MEPNSLPDDTIFSGSSGAECEAFIRAVRKHAFSVQKQRDPAYMADYASTCLDGAALRWFDQDLDDATREDWNLLRTALLQKWPADYEPQPSNSGFTPAPPPSFIPTPAAAAPPAAAAASSPVPRRTHSIPSPDIYEELLNKHDEGLLRSHSAFHPNLGSTSQEREINFAQASASAPSYPPQSLPQEDYSGDEGRPSAAKLHKASTTLGESGANINAKPARPKPAITYPPSGPLTKGRIKVILEGDSKTRYLRARLNGAGSFKCTGSTWYALKVQYHPRGSGDDRPTALTMTNCSASEGTLLGITWAATPQGKKLSDALGRRSTLYADLCAVNGDNYVFSTSSGKPGPSGSIIWTIRSSDQQLFPVWVDSESGMRATLDFLYMDEWIYVCGNAQSFIASKNEKIWYPARLFLDTI